MNPSVDMRINLAQLTEALQTIKYSLSDNDKDDIVRGNPRIFLRILQYLFFSYSKYFRQHLISKQYFLSYTSDYDFVDMTFDMLSKEYKIPRMITTEQFLSNGGFIEQRIKVCQESIKIARREHKQQRLADEKNAAATNQHMQRQPIQPNMRATSIEPISAAASEGFKEISQQPAVASKPLALWIRSVSPVKDSGEFILREESPDANQPFDAVSVGLDESRDESVFNRGKRAQIQAYVSRLRKRMTDADNSRALCVQQPSFNVSDNDWSKSKGFANAVKRYATNQERINRMNEQIAQMIEKVYNEVLVLNKRLDRIEKYLNWDGESFHIDSKLPPVLNVTSKPVIAEETVDNGMVEAESTLLTKAFDSTDKPLVVGAVPSHAQHKPKPAAIADTVPRKTYTIKKHKDTRAKEVEAPPVSARPKEEITRLQTEPEDAVQPSFNAKSKTVVVSIAKSTIQAKNFRNSDPGPVSQKVVPALPDFNQRGYSYAKPSIGHASKVRSLSQAPRAKLGANHVKFTDVNVMKKTTHDENRLPATCPVDIRRASDGKDLPQLLETTDTIKQPDGSPAVGRESKAGQRSSSAVRAAINIVNKFHPDRAKATTDKGNKDMKLSAPTSKVAERTSRPQNIIVTTQARNRPTELELLTTEGLKGSGNDCYPPHVSYRKNSTDVCGLEGLHDKSLLLGVKCNTPVILDGETNSTSDSRSDSKSKYNPLSRMEASSCSEKSSI